MSGFLKQIERRQERMQQDVKRAHSMKEPPSGKTIGVRFPMPAYNRIARVKEKYGLKTIKATLLFITEKGTALLLDDGK